MDFARYGVGKIRGDRVEIGGVTQQQPSLLEQRRAGRGQFDAVGRLAHEKFDAEGVFQMSNSGGNRRLGDVQFFGARGDRAVFGGRDEITQMAQ